VRLFAAAREAAGTATVEIPAGPVIPALHRLDLGERFDRVLDVCSVISDGLLLGAQDCAADDDVVDVLPPFAGG
jgi:molybdopterin converting factor small subunit